MSTGIAGWPLRDLSAQDVARAVDMVPVRLAELPKDLFDAVSIKRVFEALAGAGKTISFAGTTDLARLSGMSWSDYRRYLDIQIASARFLGCAIFRGFLGSHDADEQETALARLRSVADENPDIEMIVETHGGFESTLPGFLDAVALSRVRFVVDFANIADQALVQHILAGGLADRIAYFHVRNLGDYREAPALVPLEDAARRAYPQHTFLWEPKDIGGLRALEVLASHSRADTDA